MTVGPRYIVFLDLRKPILPKHDMLFMSLKTLNCVNSLYMENYVNVE